MLDLQSITQEIKDALHEKLFLRLPSEACGVILPTPYRGQYVIELPNRSLTAHRSFIMWSTDLQLEIGPWLIDHGDRLGEVIFWHTHPSGDPEPSVQDLANRVVDADNLVVTYSGDTRNPLTLTPF